MKEIEWLQSGNYILYMQINQRESIVTSRRKMYHHLEIVLPTLES